MKRSAPIPVAPPVERTEIANWAALRLRFTWAHDGPLAPRFRDCRYTPTGLAAWLLREGSVLLRCGAKSHRATEGQWLFLPNVEGWQTFSPDAHVLTVRFVAVWPDGTPLYEQPEARVFESRSLPVLEHAGRALASYVRTELGDVHTTLQGQTTDLARHLRLQELFFAWIRAYAEAQHRADVLPRICAERDDRLARAVRFLNDHPLDKPVPEKLVAQAAGLSVSQLNRLFTSRLHVTPKRHFDLRRIEQAAALLAFTDVPVKNVAYSLGFSSLPHFTNWFKRQFGVPPTLYRDPRTPLSDSKV